MENTKENTMENTKETTMENTMENTNKELLKRMFELQDKLNIATNGEEWKSNISKNKSVIDWIRCIFNETSEFQNSYQWKHWKSTVDTVQFDPIDFKNAQMEWIDIWHFYMSLMLSYGAEESIIDIVSKESFLSQMPEEDLDKFNILNLSEQFIFELLSLKFEDVDEGVQIRHMHVSLELFFIILKKLDLTIESLYKLYVVKNILNGFRQDHGYKEGTYIKIWNGAEDNEAARKLMDENPEISPKEFYDKLEENYSKL